MTGRDASRAALAGVVGALLLVLAAASAARAADQVLELEVVINGASTGKIGEFVLRDGRLLSRPEEVGALGLALPEDAPRTADGLVVLSAVPGIEAELDQPNQVLRLTAKPARLKSVRLQAGRPAGGALLRSGWGVVANYDVSGQSAAGAQSANGLFDLRAFSPAGVASTGLLVHAGPVQAAGQEQAVRLDSTYVYSDYPSDRRYRLGDMITGGLSWTRPVRVGGVQVSRDFSMRPDLVTFPVPQVTGLAAVPSTVELLVNGSRVLQQPVPSGPFQVPQLPVVTGAGMVTMTVTDALGRQVTTTLPFYASSDLLAPGLRTWSFEGGQVRRNWGVVSNDYGGSAAVATWRGGISRTVTLEAHAEGGSGVAMGGAGAVANLFDLAVVHLAAGGSTGSDGVGGVLSLGAQRITHQLDFGVSAVLATRGYRDLAAVNGDPVPWRQIAANVGLTLRRWGSFGLAYAEIDRPSGHASAVAAAGPSAQLNSSRVLTANYSVQLGRVFLYAVGFKDFAGTRSTGVTVGLSLPIGRRGSVSSSANASAGSAAYAEIQAQQSVVSIGDLGYQAYAQLGGAPHLFAQGQYKSPWGLLTAGLDQLGGTTTGRLEAQGALTFADRRLFASNEINDSFAVVDVDGVKGVKVLYENRDAGRTDAGGRRLVPDLIAFQQNRLAIDPTDLPADAAIARSEVEVRPPDRSGVVVRFPVRVSRGALLVLVDEVGQPVPLGSTATLEPAGGPLPVGYDGEAYVQDLGPDNRLTVREPDGRTCVVQFRFRPVKGDIPKIGPLACRRAAP